MTRFVQNDNLIGLNFTLVPINTVYTLADAIVKLYIKKPDATVTEKTCVVTSETACTCTAVLLSTDLDTVGLYKLEITVYKTDGGIVSNPQLAEYEVVKSIRSA